MNSFIYQLLVFFLIYVKSVHSYPTGAPNTVCKRMVPGHGVGSLPCSTKYIIKSDKSEYSTTDTVRITVNGSTSSDTFRGFLLIAKTQTSGQIIGTWSVVGSTIQTLNCDKIANTGVTHTSNSDKTSIEATWSPPSTISTENTTIKVTIVTTFTQVYIDCFSVTLMNRQDNQSTNGTVENVTTNGTVGNVTTNGTVENTIIDF